jgi:hypothetical protein
VTGAALGRTMGWPRGMSPKYLAISVFASADLKSPVSTKVALFGA